MSGIRKTVSRGALMASAGALAMAMACVSPAFAQPTVADEPAAEQEQSVSELIVNPEIIFRNRTVEVNPVLSYDLEYFQRFEPVSVGEMLKRTPGITFTSDVLEFDGVSMRGLPPGYTQILINGRRAPGGENDRSFFVDRVPAELVERIEIIRSPRADEPSDGMAGSLNIVLKDGAALRGGLAKVGALINEDGEIRPSGAIAYAGGNEATSWWGALNYQGRRNPKKKVSERFSDDFGAFDDTELQDDTRDGVDLSANGEVTHEFDFGRVRLNGLVIDTDRDEDETSLTYTDQALSNFDGAELQAERIKQRTYAFGADGKFDFAGGELDLDLGWNSYDENTTATGEEAGEEDFSDREVSEFTKLDIDDHEWDTGLAYTRRGTGWRLKTGVDYLNKNRDFAEIEHDVDNGVIGDPDPEPGAVHTIKERRVDPYLRLTLDPTEAWTFDLGARYETTSRDVTSDDGTVSFDDESLNPSLHATWRPNDKTQVRFSVARTVRRPDYDLLAPHISDEEPTDEDALQGNALLKNEKAWGYDLGFEYRLGKRGVFGVNLFYRDVEDLIEVVNTGATFTNVDGDDFNLYEPRNIGDGKTWGLEFDFSSSLSAIGLPDTGLFFNYTLMDSEVRDPFTGLKRTFTNQPDQVYNIGFVHTLNAWNASFGASLYGRSEGHESGFDEEVTVDYDDDLEAFVEKRFGEKYVVRLAAMNLLDKEKRETFRAYDGDNLDEITANRLNGIVDSSESERERSGVLYQVTFRAAF